MTHIKQRRDTSANWTSANPVLQAGEVGWETNTRKSKLGDGVTAWNSLPYATQPDGVVSKVAGKTGDVTLVKADVGLSNVNNTADSEKPISVAQQAALDLKAPLASPTFTGDPKAPTPATSDNDTSIATTAFVKAVLAAAGDNTNKTIVIGGVRIQWGTVNVTMGGAAYVAQSITFPTAFSGTPTFVFTTILTAQTNKLFSSLNSTVGSPSATQAHIATKTGDGSTSTATPTVYWLAIGPA